MEQNREPTDSEANQLTLAALQGSLPSAALSVGVRQASLSMGFSRQEYWSRLSFPSPGDLPNPGIEAASPSSPALAGGFFTTEPLGKPLLHYLCSCNL